MYLFPVPWAVTVGAAFPSYNLCCLSPAWEPGPEGPGGAPLYLVGRQLEILAVGVALIEVVDGAPGQKAVLLPEITDGFSPDRLHRMEGRTDVWLSPSALWPHLVFNVSLRTRCLAPHFTNCETQTPTLREGDATLALWDHCCLSSSAGLWLHSQSWSCLVFLSLGFFYSPVETVKQAWNKLCNHHWLCLKNKSVMFALHFYFYIDTSKTPA